MITKERLETRQEQLNVQLQEALQSLEQAKTQVTVIQGALALIQEFLHEAIDLKEENGPKA